MDLTDKVVLVTGAARGIGHAVALRMTAEGARVAMAVRNRDKASDAIAQVQAVSSKVYASEVDLTVAARVEAMVADVLAHFGTIDVLVNCAFWGPPASLEETTEAVWDRTIDSTLKSVYLCARAVLPTFKAQRGGRIVTIGSLAGKIGEDNRTAYCAAKWGVEGLMAALRVEMLKHNVHVHLVSPAATATPSWADNGVALEGQILERMIPPETIAEAVVWVLKQPDQVIVPDVPVYNFRNPFEGKASPFADS
jgi:NAD(P)-dependent dehydrogenase (short-subunit alcohol dehydrogenase family)